MLTKLFPTIRDQKIVRIINKVFASPFYIGFVAILVCLAEIFSFEFIAYYVLISLSIVFPSFFLDDMTASIPGITMLHIAMSKKTFDQENTIILGNNIHHFYIMFSLICIFLIGRLAFDITVEKERRHFPRFLIGYVALLISYLMGGAFSKYYDIKTFGFGLLEIASIGGFYFYFVYTIDWKNFKKDYFAYLFFFFGLAISVETIVLIIQNSEEITTGWGIRNDIGGTLAMTIAGAGYLAVKKKAYINWLFVVGMLFILVACAFTESRGGFVATFVMTIVCSVLIMVFTNWVKRLTSSLIIVAFVVTFICLYIFKHEMMMERFGRILEIDIKNLDDFSSGRITIWKIGIEQWKENKAFGVGWLQTTFAEFKFPPRYHNTYIQLLASTGIVGIVAYTFHRFETIFVTFRRPNLEKVYALLCIIGLMIANLFDCHFFNIWLGFGYSFLVANLEWEERKQIEQRKIPQIVEETSSNELKTSAA